jgi:energy-coupling factor transporter transmembrane protein EcfT
MEEQKENNQSSFPVKLIGYLFAILAIPFKFFIANPKIFLVFLVIAASVGGTVYIARTNPKLLGIQNQTVDQTREEIERLVNEVGEIIVLPEGETPTLATVTNVDEVKGQLFFSNAQNGDKVLIYSVAGKAYLYRPSEKKIIEVGVVNLGQNQESGQDNQEVFGEEALITPGVEVTLAPEERPTPTPTPTTNI